MATFVFVVLSAFTFAMASDDILYVTKRASDLRCSATGSSTKHASVGSLDDCALILKGSEPNNSALFYPHIEEGVCMICNLVKRATPVQDDSMYAIYQKPIVLREDIVSFGPFGKEEGDYWTHEDLFTIYGPLVQFRPQYADDFLYNGTNYIQPICRMEAWYSRHMSYILPSYVPGYTATALSCYRDSYGQMWRPGNYFGDVTQINQVFLETSKDFLQGIYVIENVGPYSVKPRDLCLLIPNPLTEAVHHGNGTQLMFLSGTTYTEPDTGKLISSLSFHFLAEV